MKRLAFAALRRILLAIVIVWGVTSATWVLTTALPGDPVQAVLGPNASPADVEKARSLWGLDEPLSARYVRFMRRLVHRGDRASIAPGSEHASCGAVGDALHVDLGTSHIYRKPVVELVKKKLPFSLELAIAALLVQILIGGAFGALAAIRRGGKTDQIVVALATALGAAPTFVVGIVLQFVLAHRLGWLPLDGQGSVLGGDRRALVLPALTLGVYGAAIMARVVRSELGDALSEAYTRTARAKGASPTRVVVVHALRNAIGPVAQLAVLELGALVGGAIVTERLFRWPGLGEMSVVAIQNRDAQALVGVTLVASTAVVLATMAADLVSLALDPRKR